ncbi:hypothetical protein ACH492_27905 [Streptomyces sp. NPDC019443]|uniref:hypothetical protein n=1 Tax=Streptomyces sp. NPDC019443 TaxID=3365061 RepID=UPI00378ADC2C
MERKPHDDELTVFLPHSHPADEATSATLLDDAVWGMPAATDGVHSTATATASPSAGPPSTDLGDLTAVWRSTVPAHPGAPYTDGARRRHRRRRGPLRGWLPTAVAAALAAVALLAWQWADEPLTVTGATARPNSAGIGCDSTVTVLGTLRTNGEGGTVSYRWRRSDGAVTGPLRQRISRGIRLTDVTLRWTFHGPGTVKATAVLEVLSPNRADAAATFTYTCR